MYDILVTWSIILVAVLMIYVVTYGEIKLRKILYIALFARLLLMIIDAYIYSGLPYLTAADTGRFQRGAIWFYENLSLKELILPPYPSGSTFYSYIMALFYSLLGSTDINIIRAINITAGVFTIYNVYHISYVMWSKKIAMQNALIIAVFPLMVVYAQNPIRESFVVYFMTLGFMYLVSFYKNRTPQYLIYAVIGFAISTALHMAALMALIALMVYNVVIMISSIFKGKLSMIIPAFLAVIITSVGLFYLNTTGWGLTQIGGEGSIGEFGIEELIEQRGGDIRYGRAAYLVGMTANNPVDVAWQTPIRMIYFLFSPFPWMMGSIWDLVGIFDALLYLFIFWGIYKSYPLIKQDPAKLSVLFMLIGMILAFAWGVTNFGTAMRHRAKIVSIAICLAPHLYPLRKVIFNKFKKNATVIWTSKWLKPL